MTHYTTLISIDQLASILTQPDLRIVDCRFSLADTGLGRRSYKEDHIPGAIYAHLDQDLSSEVRPDTGRHPLPDPAVFAKKIQQWAISPATQVVVYDDGPGMIAARLWWMMRWAGHESVALLDGGYGGWKQAGMVVSDQPTRIDPLDDIPYQSEQFDHDLWIDVTTLSDRLKNKVIRLIDARAPTRFRGDEEPLDKVAGHIPGSVNFPFMRNLDDNGRFKHKDELVRQFAQLLQTDGDDQDASRVAHTCGSGVTACHNLLAMEVAGYSGSKLYAGSWSEWIADPKRPIATGS